MELIPIIQSALLIFVVLLTIVITTSYILSRINRPKQAGKASAGLAMTSGYQNSASAGELIPLYPESENEEYKMHLHRMSQYNTPVQSAYAHGKAYHENYGVNNSYYSGQSYNGDEMNENTVSQQTSLHEARRSGAGRMNNRIPKYSVHNTSKTSSRFTVINKNMDDAAANAPEPVRYGYSYPVGQNSAIMFK